MKNSTFTPPTLQDVIDYFIQNGYKEEVAIRMFKGYEVAEWVDSKGKKIRNWRQKAIHVWFKPENKIKDEKPSNQAVERLARSENIADLRAAIRKVQPNTGEQLF